MSQSNEEGRADEARFQHLRDLGLTEYGARTYLALLRLGRAEARAVSDVARVPQSKIYAVLDDLADVGLVHMHPEHPKKYSAAELASYLDERRSVLDQKARALTARRSEILDLFRTEQVATPVLPGLASQVRGRTQIARKVTELLVGTQRSWLVMGVPTTPTFYEDLREELERARERGVSSRFLLPVSARTVESARWLAALAELRAREGDPELARRVTVLVSDSHSAMLIHWASLAGDEAAKDTALVTTDPAVASVIEYLVESMWATALPFDAAAASAADASVRR